MDPQMLQALVARLMGGASPQGMPGNAGAMGALGRLGQGSPPIANAIPPNPAVSPPTTPPAQAGGPTGGLPPQLGQSGGPNLGPMSSPGPMPTPAPQFNQGLAAMPGGQGRGGNPSSIGGGAAEPTESGGPPAQNQIPPIQRSPLGALLMPNQFPMGAGGNPSSPWNLQSILGGFLNRTPTGGIGG